MPNHQTVQLSLLLAAAHFGKTMMQERLSERPANQQQLAIQVLNRLVTAHSLEELLEEVFMFHTCVWLIHSYV